MRYGKRCFSEYDEDHYKCTVCPVTIRRLCKEAEAEAGAVTVHYDPDGTPSDDEGYDEYDVAALKKKHRVALKDRPMRDVLISAGKSSAWEAVRRMFGSVAVEASRRRDKD
jgi:hypothetical protein